ncbi:TTAGGG repeat binding factor [Madurella fahalii]|uniref:TTAGGG repeat binding factor n=1 Tax=Madurella fahalii TaxID=1157608 RepID=A0ABQ0G755_9PEZI
MADASQLEADLLAALGASMPEADKPAADSTGAPQSRRESQPAQGRMPDSLPTPTTAESTSQAPASASAPIAVPVAAPPAPAPSAPDPLRPSGSSSKTSSPSPFQLAELLAPSRIDAALQTHPKATPVSEPGSAPVPAPQEAAGLRSPKRARSPDHLDVASTKRQKTEPGELKEERGVEAPNLDLAAMLNDALADFDQQAQPAGNDVMMHDVNAAREAAPADTTPEAEKLESKIVKVSGNPFLVMRSMSLPILGNVAVQILLRLSQQPRAETETLLADAESEFRKAYDMLRDIFRPTRKAFSDSPLLSPDELDIADSEDRETIRISNLAATAASGLGAHDVPLQDIHDAFFSIFIPEDGEIRAPLTGLLVCLKTRLYLDALETTEPAQPASQLLDTLFPVNFDESLKQRSGESVLSAVEEELVSQVRERRELLVKCAAEESIRRSLEDQSSMARLADSLSTFLQGHLGVVVDYAEKYGVNIPLSEEEMANGRETSNIRQPEDDGLAALLQSATSHFSQNEEGGLGHVKDGLSEGLLSEPPGSIDDGLDLKKLIEQSLSTQIPELKVAPADHQAPNATPDFDSKNLASLISEKLKNDLEIPTHGLPNLSTSVHAPNVADPGAAPHSQYTTQLNHTHPPPYPSYTQSSTSAPPVGAAGEILPPNQSLPTAALYEKARQAAVAKSSNTTRREGLHSTRRPWTPEEEKALMAGLDMVKGPHWSQILSLFGQHGTISDILKDRTQVQLKDKARNLKLFFLKTNSEMPYYLQSVTGELKTRAPSQAARKEAEEKARLNAEEEQARFQGIVALASGLQNNHHPITSSPLAVSPGPRASPVTPTVGGASTGATVTPNHAPTGSAPALPPVRMSPPVKTEQPDHHPPPKATAFPPIQPAPTPAPPVQPALKLQLPPLQPQPSPQHQQPKQAFQQPQQQQPYQQPRQDLQKVHQQQRHPLPQQPQTQPQPPSQMQPKPQLQAQATAQVLTPTPNAARATTQTPQTSQPPPPPSAPTQRPSPSQTQPQQQPQPAAKNVANPPAFVLPPIPPNHHSTPDHAQDTKLFETLQAAIAASSASESQTQAPVATPEGTAGTAGAAN